MTHRLDLTEEAYEIMLKNRVPLKKPKRLTERRKNIIDHKWFQWETLRDALIKANLYGGSRWSGDRKYPRIDINTKEKFTKSMLEHHSLMMNFTIELD